MDEKRAVGYRPLGEVEHRQYHFKARYLLIPEPVAAAIAQEFVQAEEDKMRLDAEAKSLAAEQMAQARSDAVALVESTGAIDDDDECQDDPREGNFERLERLKSSGIQIFKKSEIKKCEEFIAGMNDDTRTRHDDLFQSMCRDGGYRSLPSLEDVAGKLDGMEAEFENMTEVIARLRVNLALAAAGQAQDYRVDPLILVSNPGTGKTFFCTSLKRRIGIDTFEKFSAGAAQAAFQLTGTNAGWSNAMPGLLLRMLAKGKTASPLLLIDEIDKMPKGESRWPMTPILLDLLDAGSSQRMKDECLQVHFNASHMMILMTANDARLISDPVLSRCEVITVPDPDFDQRLRIIGAEHAALQRRTGRSDIGLDADVCRALAGREDLDLRRVVRLVKEAFAMALLSKADVATPQIPPYVRKQIGFM